MKLGSKALRAQPRLVLIERLLAHERLRRASMHRIPRAARQVLDELDGDGACLLLARTRSCQRRARHRRARAARHRQAGRGLLAQRAWLELHHQRGDWPPPGPPSPAPPTASAPPPPTTAAPACGRTSEAWIGYCGGCGRWDTYRAGEGA
ncbi:MAG: hypothetical protein U0802_24720 [Candidatus Binatia bacterium]